MKKIKLNEETTKKFKEALNVFMVNPKKGNAMLDQIHDEQEEKDLLLRDLCARLPYGVKLLVEGWDSDIGCEFDTVETLIGIDDRFIHTIWDKTGDKEKHSIVEPLSILDYKPYLRPLSSMTDEEYEEFGATRLEHQLKCIEIDEKRKAFEAGMKFDAEELEYLYSHHYDVRGLIPKGFAISTEIFNPYK